LHQNRYAMVDRDKVFLGILIFLAFLWRFARTRQLYLTSLTVKKSGSDPISFHPSNVRNFIDQALLGRRSISPGSFFIRAAVFVFAAICLFPLKHYEAFLFWLVVILISLYAPWCIAHGFLLRKKTAEEKGR
jgi:hypothetical protein